MSLMKFYEGSEAKAQSYLDGLYLASDSSKLYYNGKSYTPDLTNMQNSIGTNVYTDSNYISKETNLTSAVLQLDEEIKATNDNLALEHANAEATYAKKTELSGYLPLTGGTLTGALYVQGDKYTYPNFGISASGMAYYEKQDFAKLFSIGYNSKGEVKHGIFGLSNDTTPLNEGDDLTITPDGVTLKSKTSSDLLHAAGGTISIDEIGTQLSEYTMATKGELRKYLPLTGGKIYGDGLIISSKYLGAVLQEKQSLFLNVEDPSKWAGEVNAVKYVPEVEYQGVIVSTIVNIGGNPEGKPYACLTGGGLICSNGMRTHSMFGKSFVSVGIPVSQAIGNQPCNGSISLTGKIWFFSTEDDASRNPRTLSSISYEGITLKDKTNQDLLHAAGGTVSIQDIIDQANVPTNVSQLTNDAGYQTEAQVSAKVSALVNSAPETLDTLKELADALGNDPNFATTISTELGKKLDTSTYNADKATFALKSELPDMSQYTTTTNLQSTYLAKTDASNTYQPKGSYLTSIPSEYVTDTELNAKGYVTKTTADSTYQPKGNYLTSVSWDQVGSKPSWIGSSKPSYTWDEIGSKPSFATVATSGSYNDLSNKPSIPQPTVKAASGTLTLWTGTESEYNTIATKDPNTLYFILES